MQAQKYTILGTSVLVVEKQLVPDGKELSTLATELADPDFGVGATIVAYVEKVSRADLKLENGSGTAKTALLKVLQQHRLAEAHIVRAFVASGHELELSPVALCATADFLHNKNGQREQKLISHTANDQPRLHHVYRSIDKRHYNVALGEPERMPSRFSTKLYREIAYSHETSPLLEVISPTMALASGTHPFVFYALTIGEPHLVCFVGEALPAEVMEIEQDYLLSDIFDQPQDIQSRILTQIVTNLNGYSEERTLTLDLFEPISPLDFIFPPATGINVVFAQVHKDETISARFFLRGICEEVRLSGSGAAAAVIAAHSLGLLPEPHAQVRGNLNLLEGRQQPVSLQHSHDNWWFEAPIQHLWTGDVELLEENEGKR